jgi:tRNA splicing endonuclease
VEAATSVVITPDTLRERADKREAEAESLQRRSREARLEAMRLRREANALETAERLALAAPGNHDVGKGGSTDARAAYAREVATWFARCRTPKSSTEVAAHFNWPITRTRSVLDLLIEQGVVLRTGLKRGTRYRLKREGEVIAHPRPHGERWHERVRDAAIRLETFTKADMHSECEGWASPATVDRWLAKLVDDEVLSVERVGNKNLYAYEGARDGAHVPRTKHEPPERIATRLAGPAPRRGSVEGIGKGERVGSPVVDALVREVRQHGVTIRRTKHRIDYVLGDRVIAHSSKTPGASSLKETRSDLRKAGIPV